MDDFRRELIEYRIERAREECLQSEIMLINGFFRKSVNCSYYAVFHAIRALAARDGFEAKKHSSVLAFFNKEYVLKGYAERVFGRLAQKAFVYRNESDYKDFVVIDRGEAEELLSSTKVFVAKITGLLKDAVDAV